MQYTVLPAQPVARPHRPQRLWNDVRRSPRVSGMSVLCVALAAVVLTLSSRGTLTPGSSSSALFGHRRDTPGSWVGSGTLVTVYGRAFRTAPILGQLGTADSLDDVARHTAAARARITQLTDGRPVRMAIHLIYGLAVPCSDALRCLLYLDDDAGVNVVRRYIEPAARRGWLVILDDQLGGSDPEREMQRLRAKGYLGYDNVQVAFDPEFRVADGSATPGLPPGHVTAAELNAAQRVMERASEAAHLAHRKLLLVHQWMPDMIADRAALRTNSRYVQPAIVMDAIGPADEKANTYNQLLKDSLVQRGVLPGIKLFPSNPYDPYGRVDTPMLSWPQLLTHRAVSSDTGQTIIIDAAPRIIVLT